MKTKTIGMILISVVLLLFLVHKIGLEKMYLNILKADLFFLLWSLALMPIIILFRILRWYYLVGFILPKGKLSEATKSLLGASLMSIISPGKVGDLVRGLYYSEKRGELTALVVFEKSTDLLSYIVLSIFMAFKLGNHLGWMFLLASLLIFIGVLRLDLFCKLALTWLPEVFKNKLEFLANLGRSDWMKKVPPVLICLSIFITVLTIYQFYLMLNAFGPVDFGSVFLAFPLSILLSVIPISFGGLGVREGSMIYLLALFNVPEESALNASLSFYLANVVPMLCGILFFPKFWKGFKEIVKGKIKYI